MDWHDGPSRFPEDRLLRYWGYEIRSRPEHGQAIWRHRRTSTLHSHGEAIRRVKEFQAEHIPAENVGAET